MTTTERLRYRAMFDYLPYEVEVMVMDRDGGSFTGTLNGVGVCADGSIRCNLKGHATMYPLMDVWPILRKAADMTEEEKKEWSDMYDEDMMTKDEWRRARHIDIGHYIVLEIALDRKKWEDWKTLEDALSPEAHFPVIEDNAAGPHEAEEAE